MCQGISMRQYSSSPRKYKRRETACDCRVRSSALHLASSLAASFPGRNKCPGTHCNLVVQWKIEDRSAREFEVKGKTKDRASRKERESEMRRREVAD